MRNLITRVLALLLMLLLLASCAPATNDEPAQTDSTTQTNEDKAPTNEDKSAEDETDAPAADDQQDEAPAASTELQLPITTNGEHFEIFRTTTGALTIWNYEDLNDVPGYAKVQELTGVTIDWIIANDWNVQFPLMLASEDWPDASLCYTWQLPKSVTEYVDSDIMMDLTDIITENCPNYMRERTMDEDIARRTITDDGRMVNFYTIKKFHDEPLPQPSWYGMATRQDWLDAFGTEPTTFDEFHDYLKFIKDTYNPEFPFFMDADGLCTFLIAGFDISKDWIVVDGEVRYSPVTEEYKEYVTLMHQWYEEGLFNPNFYGETRRASIMYDEITGGDIGVFSTLYDMFGTTEKQSDDPNFRLRALATPMREGHDKRLVCYAGAPGHRMEDGCTAFFVTCENPVMLAKYCDFYYTKEGTLLSNYGVEGVDVNYVDGVPVFTDEITGDPTNSARTMWQKYTAEGMTRIYDWGRDLNSTMSQSGFDAIDIWDGNWVDTYSYPTVSRTASENEIYSETMPDIETYWAEHVTKYIIGLEDLSTYDQFIENIWAMNLQEAIDVQQAAYDRFMNRGK